MSDDDKNEIDERDCIAFFQFVTITDSGNISNLFSFNLKFQNKTCKAFGEKIIEELQILGSVQFFKTFKYNLSRQKNCF